MHPLTSSELATTRAADLHAKPAVTRWPAPPARPAAHAPTSPGTPHPHTASVRRLLAALGARTSA